MNTLDALVPFLCILVGIAFMVLLAFGFIRIGRRQALRVIQQFSPRCPQCEYDMSGLREAKCPECGWFYTLDELWKAHSISISKRLERRQ